jgi:RNase P/RNase MRP subunit p29
VNVIGEDLTVIESSDPGKVGRKGRVLLETANTLLIDSGGSVVRVEKSGASFLLQQEGLIVTGKEIAGRLQSRLGRTQD